MAEDTAKPKAPKQVDSTDPKNLMRDTWILEGKATFQDRTNWQKAWSRASKLGAMELIHLEEARARKKERKAKNKGASK